MSAHPHLQPATPPALYFILQAVNAANPKLPAALNLANVSAGLPSVMPAPTASGINTTVTLSAIAGSGYTDTITLYYPRADLGQLFPSGMSAIGDSVESWAALATSINNAHGTVLTTADLPTSAFHVASLPAQLTVTLPATSLLYQGTITVSLSGSQPALSTVVTVTALSGLNAPTAPSSPSDLTQSASTLIYGLVNTANPAIPNGGLSTNNAILGTPVATGATPNTSLQIASAANQGYTGYVTVTYHRLDIQTEVSDPLVSTGLQLADSSTTPYSTVLDLLSAINTALAVNLQASDIANGSTAITGTTYPKAVSVVLASTCLTLVGALAVSIVQPVALTAMVTSQSLNGFELPQLQ